LGKFVSQEELILQRREWKGNGKKIVFLAGSFDLLHPGHIRLLEQAREHGDRVIVGVLNDAGVRARAGQPTRAPGSVERPITPACERAEVLAGLAAVDYTFELDALELPVVLGRLRPDAIIEGSAPSAPASAVRAAARAAGIEVMRIPLEPGYSTSRLIERITQLRA
jgi:rfaE bifunctional protein nucleotidyltransferase chain/domain